MIYDIFIDTLLCGATGYITNKYVINMMFKKYSIFNKFRCGDSIINSKIQFVKNVSTMMEKDIINAQKISQTFLVHNFDKEFENFSNDFFSECICRDIKNLRLKDLPVFYDTCSSCKDIFTNVLNNNISAVINYLSENIELPSIISKKQTEHISENIFQNIILTVKNTDLAQKIASDTFDAFCDVKINEIVSKDVTQKIKSNIEKESAKFGNILKQGIDEEIDNACNEILHLIDINGILEKVQAEFFKRPIKSFVNLSTADIRIKVVDNLIDFISSDKGEKAIANMYYEIIGYMGSSDITLRDVYKRNYEQTIKDLMQSKINNITYSIMQWIDNNNPEINDTIKNSINEIISGNEALKSKIFITINEYFNSKKYSKDSIVSLLLEFATSGDNLDKITSFIIAEIDNYLKSTTMKDVVKIFEEKKLINSNKLNSVILKFLSSDNKNVLDMLIDNIISKPIGSIVNVDLIKIFNSKLKYVFIDYIKDNTFYSKQLHSNTVKEINKYIYDVFDEKISEIIDKNFITDNINSIKNTVLNDLINNKTSFKNGLNNIIEDFVSKNGIIDLLDKLSETNNVFDIIANEKLTNIINKSFVEHIDDIGDIRISKILSKINSVPNIHNSLSDFMKNVVGESIATVTEGYINEVINKHFDDFTDNDFRQLIGQLGLIDVKNQPVNGCVAGATLGLCASLASNFLFEQSLINSVFSWQGAVMCSLIGVSTGLLATNSFSPYSTNNLIKGIPLFRNCTDDFIREKQQNFASYMSKVIEDNLINENTISDLVQSKSTQLKQNIHKTIVEDDYEQIYKCIENNNKYIASNVWQATKKAINGNCDNISIYAAKNISNIPIKQILNRKVIDSIMDFVSSNDDVFDSIYSYMSRHITANTSVLSFIPKYLLCDMNDDIKMGLEVVFNSSIEFVKSTEDLRKYLKKYNKAYESIIMEPMISVISPRSIDIAESNLFNECYNNIFINDVLVKISENIYAAISEQFNKDKNLGDILNRRNKVFLIGMYYKYFKDIMLSLQSYLIANRHGKIEKDIKEKLLNSLDLKEKIDYNSIGGDKVLGNIINNLILIKVPIFFEKNFEQFYDISKTLVNYFFDNKIDDLNISLDYQAVENNVKNLFLENATEGKSSIVKNKCYLLYHLYMTKYDNEKFINILRYFGLNSIDSIFARYNDEISLILKQLYINVKKNKQSVLREINDVVDMSSNEILNSLSIKKMFSGIAKNEMLNIKSSIKGIIDDNDLIYLSVNNLINCFYNYLEDIDLLESIINKEELKVSLEGAIKDIMSQDGFNSFMEDLYSQIISNDLKQSTSVLMPKKSKKYIIELLVDGFYIAIKKNLSTLFKCIDLDKITKEEISNLSLDNFKQLFNVFWKNSFKNTMCIGAVGGIIGTNKYVGLLVTLLDIIKSRPKREKKSKNE